MNGVVLSCGPLPRHSGFLHTIKYGISENVNFAKFILSSSSTSFFFNRRLTFFFSHTSMEKKKIVLKLELHDEKTKQKAMKNVCSNLGVESVCMDMKEKKLTVVGEVDITNMVEQLRKLCHADIVSVGSPFEVAVKKAEPKKVEPKKPKEGKDSKDESNGNPGNASFYCYEPYHHVEEYPCACVIC